jgi:glutamyl-tRNA synthetase
VIGSTPSERELGILEQAAPLIQERITVLGEASGMVSFLFDEEISFDQDALGQLGEDSGKIAQLAHDAIADLAEFTTEAIQAALSQALIEKAELKPRVAFGVVRTAISGRRVTPPLFESMEILGRAVTLARLEAFAKAH